MKICLFKSQLALILLVLVLRLDGICNPWWCLDIEWILNQSFRSMIFELPSWLFHHIQTDTTYLNCFYSQNNEID